MVILFIYVFLISGVSTFSSEENLRGAIILCFQKFTSANLQIGYTHHQKGKSL